MLSIVRWVHRLWKCRQFIGESRLNDRRCGRRSQGPTSYLVGKLRHSASGKRPLRQP